MANSIVQVSNLEIDNLDGELVVDSRLVATRLGVGHDVLFRTINKYLSELQQFGHLRFQNGTVTNSVGATNTVKFVYLNENQSALLMTMSRNTKQVVQCKIDLVTAFSKAKQIVKIVIPTQNDRIRELELENENLKLRKEVNGLEHTMLTIHGKSTILALRGCSDAIVREKVATTEVVNLQTGTVTEILTADQLKREVGNRTGQKLKSQKQFTDALRKSGRDDLLIAVTRNVIAEYIQPDKLDEAIDVVYGSERQRLIGQ